MKKLMNRYCAMGVLLAGSVASAEGVKVGGFVAPAYMWGKNPTANTFGIADGAVYLNHSNEMANVTIDLPFAASGTGNNFSFATGKAQAFLSHKWENGLRWQVGQFDGIYGREANDIADIRFTTQGLLFNEVPTTHTGLLLGYDFSDMLGVSVLVANPNSAGIRTAGTYDMGAKITTKVDTLNAAVGFLYQKPATDSTMTVDVTAGTKLGELDLGLEVLFKKTQNVDASFGLGADGIFAATDVISAGLRFDWLKAGATKTFEVTVGPQFTLTKALQVRADYTLEKASGTDAGHKVNVAAVYKF